MNKKWKWLAIPAVLVMIVVVALIRGCSGETDAPKTDEQLAATEQGTTVTPSETLDPNGKYVQAGLSDETWPDEEETTEETTVPEEETETTETTENTEETTESTDPTEATTETEPVETPGPAITDYESYMTKSAEEQQKFLESFPSVQDFFIWLENAKKEYEESKDYIEIGGNGPVDIGSILDKNNG